MDSGVMLWWTFLRWMTVLNLIAWGWAAWTLWYKTAGSNSWRFRARRIQIWLSLAFVLGCGFRSFFPRCDVLRTVIVDSSLSHVFWGRLVATVAELCFITQWALLMRSIAQQVSAPLVLSLTRWFVPVIAIAEVCSWVAVTTTNYLGNVIEESLWALCFVGITAGFAMLWKPSTRRFRTLLAAACVVGIGYVAFMVWVDVPLYWDRWRADELVSKSYLTIAAGLVDALTRRHVSLSWEDWYAEIPWMTLYFTGAVWLSIGAILLNPQSESEPTQR